MAQKSSHIMARDARALGCRTTEGFLNGPAMALMEECRRLWGCQAPAEFVLRRSVERAAETREVERCVKLEELAACCGEKLDRRVERGDDLECTGAFFCDFAMHGVLGVFAGLDAATGKKEARLLGDARYAPRLIKDDGICCRTHAVRVLGMPRTEAANSRHLLGA
jgi:hypothetical protein